MKKVITISIIIIVLLLPKTCLAQFDYLDYMINEYISEEGARPDQLRIMEDTPSLISINMVWSADSYVPHDYPGRALAPKGGFVDVDVIMRLSNGRPENLKYSWFVDDNFEEDESGYGKTSFRFGIRRMSGASHTVLVKIFNESRSFYLEESIVIPIVSPEIAIYPLPRNQDFSEQAKKKTLTPNNKELLFIAKPFFFSIKKPADLNYRWRFSDQEAITPTGYNANALKVIVPPKKTAEPVTKSLSVIVTNNISSIQRAFKSLEVQIN